MLKLFLLLFFATSCLNVLGQEPSYFVVGKTELANVEVYSVFYHDENDILYVSTNSGVYAYKQNQFIKLKGPKEQIGNSLFGLKRDKNGDIFCNNLNGQTFKISENSYELYHHLSKEKVYNNFCFVFDTNNQMLICSRDQVFRLNEKKELKLLLNFEITNELLGGKLKKEIILGSFSQLKDGTIYISFQNNSYSFKYANGAFAAINESISQKHFNDDTFLSINDHVFSIKIDGSLGYNPDNFIQEFVPIQNEVLSSINSNELIGLSKKRGARILGLSENVLREKKILFNSVFISAFATNKNGTLFFGTFGDGIFVVPNQDVIKYNYDHLFTGITTSPQNDVFLSTRAGEVFSARDSLKLVGRGRMNIDHLFFVEGTFNIDGVQHKNLVYSDGTNSFHSIKDLRQVDENTLLITDYNKIILYTSKLSKTSKLNFRKLNDHHYEYELAQKRRFRAVEWSKANQTVYYSDNFGLYRKKLGSSKEDTIRLNKKLFLVNFLAIQNETLICATENEGILFLDGDNLVKQINVNDGLLSNTVKKILIEGNRLYILTKLGMQIYDVDSNTFIALDNLDGVSKERVTDFCVSSNKLWLMERHSYYGIDLITFNRKAKIGRLYIDSILINSNTIDDLNGSVFSYNQNALSVHFDYRDIETKSSTKIRYRLKGFDSKWKTVKNNENRIYYQYLPPGDYTFEIVAECRGQVTKTKKYSFSIDPPYWQTWWFSVLVLVAIILVMSFFFIRRNRKIRQEAHRELEKEQLSRGLMDSRLKALRAQMNPHFIFNTLNSVQALILKQEREMSYDYVVVFSNLVRKTFQFSEQDFIGIHEECEFLEIYLSLESLRLKDSFKYSIKITGDKNVKIPSLLVQPFVENAIHHGLLHKEGEKRLEVHFQIGSSITCTITDNGVGRKRAGEIGKNYRDQHLSFSLKAIEERIGLLNQQHGTTTNYSIIDLIEEDQPTGTRVVLQIDSYLVD